MIGDKLINPVYKIFKGYSNRIWMSSDTGLYMLKKSEIINYANGISKVLNPRHYSEQDGIPSSVFNGGSQPSGWMHLGQQIYLPSKKGLTLFDTKSFHLNSISPSVKIEKITADNRLILERENIVLPPGVKNIIVDFSIISFKNRDKANRKFQLSGGDKNWEPSSIKGNSISYLNLPPSQYLLRITAANCDGSINYKGAAIRFRIKSPFHQTLWFYLILIFLLYIMSPFVYRWIITRKRWNTDEKSKYKDSKLTKVDSHIYLKKLRKIVETDKLYLDPNLKLENLSSRLGISRKVLSQLINEVLEENFKSFINTYRINEAKKKLTDPAEKDFVLLKIIYETGFNSKSVFNTAFKKHTGLTPSEYRKKYLTE